MSVEDNRAKWQAIGFLVIWFLTAIPLIMVAKQVIPDRPIVHGIDEDGEPWDRREYGAILIALPVAFVVFKGIGSIRKNGIGDQ